MLNVLQKVWRRGRSLLPVEGFAFGRPLVVLQSDDWGRVGIRDRECWDELRGQGVNLGERSYDFYSLETAEDVAELASMLQSHRDSTGRSACLGMNFILANVDFEKVIADSFQQVHLRALTEGLPDGWDRTGLLEAYREGISSGVLSPALHGMTHFCRPAVERCLQDSGDRGVLLRTLWKAGVPYIHWRMPWIGFEYWDPEAAGTEEFLALQEQEELIHSAVENFKRLFSKPPRSACAPGYRANRNTHKVWAECGIQVAQNGPGSPRAPHFEGNGILHLYRSMDFEPALVQKFSVDACVRVAEDCFARGIPAIISVHSINFHSALKDFRTRTLELLDQFLSVLEVRHSNLLYVRDEDLYDLIQTGAIQSGDRAVPVPVTRPKFVRSAIAAERSA